MGYAPAANVEPILIRPALTLLLAAAALAACSQGDGPADSSDPYAGLDAQIVAWRDQIEASHPACAQKVGGKGCESFEVTCKAAREITADEAARGVTAQLVAAFRFQGLAAGANAKPNSAFAEFTRAGGQWARAETEPVNMTSCAPF